MKNKSSSLLNKLDLFIPPIFMFAAKKIAYFLSSQNHRPNKAQEDPKPINKLQWCVIQGGPLSGRSLYMDPNGPAYQSTVLNGSYDKFLYDYLKEINWHGQVVHDVGGHIGYHTFCFAAIVGSRGQVFTFEPHPLHLERIKTNLSHNSDLENRIFILPVALSSSNGKIELLSLDNIEEGGSSASFIADASTHYPKEHYKWFHPVTVNQRKLDELVSGGECLPPDLIKIDVEGAESLVVEGALETINTYKPIIVVEVHNAPNMYQLISLLTPLGYFHRLLEEENTRCFIAFEPTLLQVE